MRIYPAALFLHILSAFVMLGTIGVEGVLLGGLFRSRDATDAIAWVARMRVNARAGGAGGLVLLASGGWMMAKVWGPQPWLVATFAGLAAMGIAMGVSNRRLKPARAALSAARGSDVPDALRVVREDRLVAGGIRFRIVMAATILALMTFKPGSATSWELLAAGVLAAAGVGFAAGGRTAAGMAA